MAGALVSAVLEEIRTTIFVAALKEVKLVTGAEEEINKLKSNLESIQALLHDAEERQIKERSIQIWLTELKELCYDMEDVLDEWKTAVLKLQVANLSQEEEVRCPFFPWFSLGRQVVDRRDIACKIKDINGRFDVIAKMKDSYQLSPRDIVSLIASREIRHVRRTESTAFTDLSKLHGRDEIKKDLVNSLLCDSSDEMESDIKTISVVGMGCVGKTALAQLIYNDPEIETHFDKRIWVSISENFDKRRVAEEIVVAFDEELSRDDLNESKSWEELNQAFKAAASGHRILVTTRKDTVVKTMSSFRVFPLKQLSDNVCWKILSQESFVGRDEEQCKSLEDIGKKIAERCCGLPLVAKTLGGMLRFKKTRDDWENVWKSEIWKLDLVQNDVFVPLLLSFYDLPSAVRRCFLYCSIFPKDFRIERDELIYQWMAQGYLGSDENAEMEIRGAEYFDCLVERSFFQDLEKLDEDGNGSIRACKIHDITVDFARFLMGNEFVSEDLHSDGKLSLEKTRHLLVKLKQMPGTNFPTLLGAEKLRSLTIFRSKEEISHQALCNSFIEPKRVRSLNIYRANIGGFQKVGNLLHLRSLHLFRSKLERLPEAVCELSNLQSLRMRDCHRLQELPKGMEKLVNLRHLDTTGSSSLSYLPKGIGRLTSLRDLRGIKVGPEPNPKTNDKFSLGDLENLCQLRALMIQIFGSKIDPNEASKANLQSKIHLKDLELLIDNPKDRDYFVQVLNPPSLTNRERLPCGIDLSDLGTEDQQFATHPLNLFFQGHK